MSRQPSSRPPTTEGRIPAALPHSSTRASGEPTLLANSSWCVCHRQPFASMGWLGRDGWRLTMSLRPNGLTQIPPRRRGLPGRRSPRGAWRCAPATRYEHGWTGSTRWALPWMTLALTPRCLPSSAPGCSPMARPSGCWGCCSGRLRERGLLGKGGRQRTDATHVHMAVRDLHRLEQVIETVRAALEALAVVTPAWLGGLVPR